MTELWPRLPMHEARTLFASIDGGTPRTPALQHDQQTYAQIGARVGEGTIANLQKAVHDVAKSYGFPSSPVVDVVAFDRAVTPVLRGSMDLSWSEAASREIWHFLTLIVLPDITEWRWSGQSTRNIERWVASDMTRHTWARLWWRATAFEREPGLLNQLLESDLNQLLERTIIGGHPTLLISMSHSILSTPDRGVPHREIIRDATRRLRRALSFVDDLALGRYEVRSLTDRVVQEAIEGVLSSRSTSASASGRN